MGRIGSLIRMIIFGNIQIATIRSGKGDCIHIRCDNKNIIVDSGPTSTSGEFRKLCSSILNKGENLDALIITHYDDDHIGGILKVGDLGFDGIYFNAYDGDEDGENLSASQNQRLFHILPKTKTHTSVLSGDVFKIGEVKITVLAPDLESQKRSMTEMEKAESQLAAISDWNSTFDDLMEQPYPVGDTSISNRASIVFILEYDEQKMLFCGDAWKQNIPYGRYDLVKLPHHGSIRNISDDMIDGLDTHSFLICADGTRHPNKQTIAKLLSRKEYVTVYSNYEWWMNGFLKPEDMKYINSGRLVFKKS